MNHSANHPNSEALFVSLISGPENADCVAIELAGGEIVTMTPAQARSLATHLITAVNRAEVKASLRVSTNLWRRMGESEERFATAAG
ncbi:MAG: hypothetical protein Q8K57_17460 [Thiobacillus sp.]|nr:hypothetical protein [Pseudomonadota bacterium]MDP1926560.1 hypothetical protein [Thiobacillus sp.]MDP2353108.1 hypothetical protein [Pseudomonadota bacterium]